MIDGIPNRPLYFYQKDIIVIWAVAGGSDHEPKAAGIHPD